MCNFSLFSPFNRKKCEKFWFVIFLLLAIAKTNAQDYRISFAAIGDINVMDNVKG